MDRDGIYRSMGKRIPQISETTMKLTQSLAPFKKENLLPALCGLVASAMALTSLIWWFDRPFSRAGEINMSIPGKDNIPLGARENQENVKIGEFFKTFDQKYSSSLRGEWPSFRGKDSSNVCKDGIKLADHWGPGGPPILWKQPLGEGHSGPVIFRGRVFVLDYLEKERADGLRCFSLITGKELWRRWYRIDIKRNHGRSRTIPAVNEKHLVTLGPMGQVMCVDTNSGKLRWGIDLVAEYKTTIPQWYTGQCPLLEGDRVILAPGGPEALLMAVDAMTGEILFKTPNPGGWKMSHSSVMPMKLQGRKMYVYVALGGMAAVAAEGKDAGKILWQTNHWTPSVIAPSPVKIDEETIYLTAGYGAGSITFQIVKEKDGFSVKAGKGYKPREALSIEQQSAILYKGVLYGIMPKDASTLRLHLVGCNSKDISQFLYTSDQSMRFGLGPFMIADDKFYVLDDSGNLSMLKPSGTTFKLLGRHRVLEGHDSWGPMAIAEGLMVLRDSTSMICIDLTEKKSWQKEGKEK